MLCDLSNRLERTPRLLPGTGPFINQICGTERDRNEGKEKHTTNKKEGGLMSEFVHYYGSLLYIIIASEEHYYEDVVRSTSAFVCQRYIRP